MISSPKELEKVVSREEAPELFQYLEKGGILRLEKKGNSIKVIYPTKRTVKEKIKELEERKRTLLIEIGKLERVRKGRRLIDPLKLKHRILMIVDSEYRDLAEKIDIERLFEDKRGRKIVEEMQKNPEYRKMLKETLENSPVYKNRRFAEFIEKTEEVKSNLLGERLQRLRDILADTEDEIYILKGLLKWT